MLDSQFRFGKFIMTDEERLTKAGDLIDFVWNKLVPDQAPITVAEEEYFDLVDLTATRILSDIQQMFEFLSDKDAWG